MPWTTPTLKSVRMLVRDFVTAQLGAVALIPNSSLRIMADAKAALAHMVLLYIDWLAKQLLPDTAEREWLDRHGVIWLTNADGSKGRQAAVYASGTLEFTGTAGAVLPQFAQLAIGTALYETTQEVIIGSVATPAPVSCLTPGLSGNLDPGTVVSMVDSVGGIDRGAVVVSMAGGVDEESDDSLRERVLFRIQNPPMGGDAADYVRWARAVPGVTRAWAKQEMGIGTISIRFMMDNVREDNYGLPTADDLIVVRSYLDTQRPVTVKDHFVEAPIPLFYSITISELEDDSEAVKAAIETQLGKMQFQRAEPGGKLYRSWVDEAVSKATGEDHHELTFDTITPANAGQMPILNDIVYS